MLKIFFRVCQLLPTLIPILWISLSPVQAETFEEGRENLSRSQAEFYNALKKNPGASKEQTRKLRDTLVRPAETSMTRILEEEKITTLRKHTIPPGARRAKKSETETPNKSAPKIDTSPYSPREDIKLDGDGIKREVDFKKR